MRKVLVAYASKHGSTEEVARKVAERLAESFEVELLPASEAGDLSSYDAVVLGGALYTGRLHHDARRLLKRLKGMPLAVFAMGPKTLAPEEVAASRAQLDRALGTIHPQLVAIFGGVVSPEKLAFPFNRMPASDARDWAAVEAWADEVVTAFSAVREPALR